MRTITLLQSRILPSSSGPSYTSSVLQLTRKDPRPNSIVNRLVIRLVVKRVVTHVELSPWGYVYYNNFLALAVYPASFTASQESSCYIVIGRCFQVWATLSGEVTRLVTEDPLSSLNEPTSLCAVGLSCVLGLGISFFGLNARRV